MKVGQIFDLPMPLKVGHIGEVRDKETQTRRLARYEVIEVEYERKLDKLNEAGEKTELVKELKGRIIVTYGNRRRKSV